mmetsp:Transcript_159101/g.296432  ORF Transcript_159101/g.296432 Transcript_159101/m.296432 type:complete len:413 (-) Transcript_159101:224-1462(-)
MAMLRVIALFMALSESALAHSAMTIPQPRESVDSREKPWGGKVPHPLPFEPWCPFPSQAAVGHDDRNISGANGQACFWFSNGCAIGCDACDGSTRGPIPTFQCVDGESPDSCDVIPNKSAKIQFGPKAPICGPDAPTPRAPGMPMKATICNPDHRTVNTAAECGSPEDYFFYSPWRAPGYAPVIDSCGSAGGRVPGQGNGGFGAEYKNTTHAKVGDLGSKTLKPRPTGVRWVAGREYEVAWTIQANHGGGYSWRLCPANSTLNEDCFNKYPLTMVGQSALRWGGVGGRMLFFDAVTITEGTKAGVMWRKNPVPRSWKTKDGKWGKGSNQFQTGMGFRPICEDDGMDQTAEKQSCTGEWGPYNMEIVDKIIIPKDLPAGEWVLNWRMDQEESNQIWQSCADVTITTSSGNLVV